MPQFNNITIKDGSATPVDVVYSVEKLSSEQTVLVDRRQASRDMQPSVTVGFDRASPSRRTFKVKHSIAYPLVRTVAGVTTSNDVARATVEFTLPSSMTADERAHLQALVANLEDVIIIKAGVKDLDPLY